MQNNRPEQKRQRFRADDLVELNLVRTEALRNYQTLCLCERFFLGRALKQIQK